MRLKNEFNALIGKINMKKTNYSEKEMAVSNDLERSILLTYEKVKKYTIWLIVSSAMLVVMSGVIYDFLTIINSKWVMWIVLGVFLAIELAILGIQIFFRIKLKKLNKQKLKEDENKNEVKKDIISLNDQISILVLSVITLNEHFYELESISDKDERFRVWKKYIKELLTAINIEYNYHPTYTEFEEYYHDYESFLEEKES